METRIKHLVLLIIRLSLVAVLFLLTLVIDPIDKAIRYDNLDSLGSLAIAVRPYLNEAGDDYKEMTPLEQVKGLIDIAIHGAKILGSDYFFKKSSIEKVIEMTRKVGWAFFLWSDLGLALQIGSFVSGAEDAGPVMVDVFVNGVYSHSYDDYSGVGDSLLVFLFATIASLLGLAYILPYRLILYIVVNVFGIIIGGDSLDDYSITGSILKSIGFYVLFIGVIFMIINGDKSNWVQIGIGGGMWLGGFLLSYFGVF